MQIRWKNSRKLLRRWENSSIDTNANRKQPFRVDADDNHRNSNSNKNNNKQRVFNLVSFVMCMCFFMCARDHTAISEWMNEFGVCAARMYFPIEKIDEQERRKCKTTSKSSKENLRDFDRKKKKKNRKQWKKCDTTNMLTELDALTATAQTQVCWATIFSLVSNICW